MYKSLDLFQTSAAMARHAGERQALVARNVANADTPGFQATRIAAFSESYQATGGADMRATRPGHIGKQTGAMTAARAVASGGEPAPNGNTVSLEEEMLDSIAISREHNRALAIYRHTMTVLRTTLGR